MPRVTLIGYRGTGKSTVAAILGERLGCGYRDADEELERRIGCSIAALVRDRGEPAFRDAEAEVLEDLLAGFAGVLATGGGVVLRPANREALVRLGRPIAWLTAPADVVRSRIVADPGSAARRPALRGGGDPSAEVEAALAERNPLYRSVADVVCDTATESPAVVAAKLAAWLEREWPPRALSPQKGTP